MMDATTYKAVSRARISLNQGEKTFVIADDKKLLHYSNKRGLSPLLDLMQNDPAALEGAVIGDKIVGRAAALMCIFCNVKAVFALIISDEAIELLEQNSILATWQETVPYIVERDLSSIYKLDLYLKNVEDPNEAAEMIKEYETALSDSQDRR